LAQWITDWTLKATQIIISMNNLWRKILYLLALLQIERTGKNEAALNRVLLSTRLMTHCNISAAINTGLRREPDR